MMAFALPSGLTPDQVEAVTTADRRLCVLAGAGAGKTRVLTLRVARRVHDRSATDAHVLVCTFSRKAADELRQRLWSLEVGDVWAATFHRTALHLLRRHWEEQGRGTPTLLADRRAVLTRLVLDEEGGGSNRWPGGRAPGRRGSGQERPSRSVGQTILQLDGEIGWAKSQLLGPEEYPQAARSAGRRPFLGADRVAEWYERYGAHLRHQRALDLDDLLWVCARALEADQRLAAAVRWRFRHLFVDEMQDVNPAQFRLLESFLGPDPDLFCVGDPNQSVYGWNGADPSLLGRLPQLVPGTRVVRLEENHRCSPQVVTVAAAVLGPGAAGSVSNRPDGPLPVVRRHRTTTEEAAWVARQAWLAHAPGTSWSRMAVLARTNAQLVPFAWALETERVPYRFADEAFGPGSDVASGDRRGLGEPGADGAEDAQGGEDAEGDQDPWAGDAGAVDGRGARDAGDGVVLSTFHRAKGLQWPVVFVVGLTEGSVPLRSARTAAALAEERRLLYVALTRAEERLFCSWAARTDEPEPEAGRSSRRPSRWLAEMETAIAGLDDARRSADPSQVRAKVDALRARLGTTGPTPR